MTATEYGAGSGAFKPFGAILPGRPASKKNSRDHVPRKNPKTGKLYVVPIPNKDYRRWEEGVVNGLFAACKGKLPKIDQPCHLEAWFFEHPMQRGDLGGYFDALCDALQQAKVLTNDRKVRAALLHPIQRDRDNPRVEFLLTPLS